MSSPSNSSVQDTLAAINAACKGRGQHYAQYSCKTVSWDDVQRGTVGGGLSCWGSNITDTRLWAKDGRSLFTVRSDNWNERLGKTNVESVALVASGVDGGASGTGLSPITLRDFLANPSTYGGYANLDVSSLEDEDLDKTVSIRFQTTFLPVPEGDKQKIEFAPEAYNYNTRSDEDPRNLVLLCTTQGLAVQQDGSGAKKLFHHAKNASKDVKRYWLEAESSNHKVGGSQVETSEERADAIQRGKATSSVIGIEAMGTRFNVLMTIQIPLKQKPPPVTRGFGYGGVMESGCLDMPMAFCDEECSADEMMQYAKVFAKPKSSKKKGGWGGGGGLRSSLGGGIKRKGKSSAARVSRGSEVDEKQWPGLTVKEPKRNEDGECITITCVMYNVCQGGVPTEEDVAAAIDDLEAMYRSCEDNGNLADEKFDFMKSKLTVDDTIQIAKKIETQPPPKPQGIFNWGSFPSFGGAKK
mmetsp:Transcript_25863/g.53790  ORF Transcript_25863/g.53790 Transcript_25863/m.53790 type:complete len:469 (+) Transcript_25863:56-1462(+)